MQFDELYTNYWSQAIQNSVDGTKIAGINEVENYLQNISIQKSDFVLDLGCSFGRMFELLARYSDNIYGVDPELSALQKAKQFKYQRLTEGTAENTNMPSKFFDLVFSWAVFDVTNQLDSLKEANRILKVGGSLLFSGKNDEYYPDDRLAFLAEKNAFLNGFPNRFTNLLAMMNYLPRMGFKLEKLYIYPRRGDMGLNVFEEFTNKKTLIFQGYEYLILCSKNLETDYGLDLEFGALDHESSRTANYLATLNGFSNARDYFISLGLD